MLQYKIPQNVGIEDKIVGPLTLRQLIILAVGGGMSYVLFSILSKIYELNFIEYAVVAIPLIVAAAFALIRIHDIAFSKFVLLTLEFGIKPKKRVWDRRNIAALTAFPILEEKEEQKISEKSPDKKNVNLRDLSRVLDSGGFNHVQVKEHEELDQAQDKDLMAEAFFGHKKDSTNNMYWRATKHDRGERLKLLAKLPPTPIKKSEPSPPLKTAAATPTPLSGVTSPQPTPPPPATQATLPKPMPPPAPKPGIPAQAIKTMPSPQKPTQQPYPAPQDLSQSPQKKKRRRRKKKNKNAIARPDTMVNTMDKEKPVTFSSAPSAPKTMPSQPQPEPKKEQKKDKVGEFGFQELQKGEIEINLD